MAITPPKKRSETMEQDIKDIKAMLTRPKDLRTSSRTIIEIPAIKMEITIARKEQQKKMKGKSEIQDYASSNSNGQPRRC
jgi:hypothetical protein